MYISFLRWISIAWWRLGQSRFCSSSFVFTSHFPSPLPLPLGGHRPIVSRGRRPKTRILVLVCFVLPLHSRLEKALEKVWRVGPNWARRFSVWWEERRGLSPNSPSQRIFFYLAPDLPVLSAVPRIRLVGDFPEPEPVGWGDFLPLPPWAS